MNDIAELVKLPDPAVQPLVHPLDLPQARRCFYRLWLFGVLTSPPVAFLIAALVWFASQSYLGPLIAGAAILGPGIALNGRLDDEAWAFIPRRRQDRRRPLPVSWELSSALLLAGLLAAVLVLVAMRLSQPDVTPAVRAVIFGVGAGVGLLVLVESIVKVVSQRGARPRTALIRLPGAAVVACCLAVAYWLLFGSEAPTSVTMIVWGGAVMLALGGLTEVGRRLGLLH
ncbi:MAG TPA: hypothetical protein VFN71_08190 [Methylomirabilota bacterium]|nr:hypothetical protein [Methylomirabilota bacterium]